MFYWHPTKEELNQWVEFFLGRTPIEHQLNVFKPATEPFVGLVWGRPGLAVFLDQQNP